MFVEVAINLPPVRGTFDYHLPPSLRGHLSPGHLVTASFGKRRVQGVVVRLMKKASVPETKPVESLLDPLPVLTQSQLELAHWISEQTVSPLIECITLMLPPGLSQKADSLYTLLDEDVQPTSNIQKRILDLLRRRGPLRGRQIARALPRQAWRPAVDALVRKDILERTAVLDPPRVGARKVRTARLAVAPEVAETHFGNLGRTGSPAEKRREAVLKMLIQEGQPVEASWIYAELDAKLADLQFLEKRDLISFGEAEIWRDPIEAIEFTPSSPPPLTSDQGPVWDTLRSAIHANAGNPIHHYLLHGVTGSGKTELYMRSVAETLAAGRQAIVLVPEIALTPQTVRRFLARFPGQIGLIHSQLSDGERYDTWRRSREGRIKIIVGPRSALFTPLPDIGLIVLDESHDESYKQFGRGPLYHTRETALAYANILHATCILGSATPDVVTTYRAKSGAIHTLHLPNRIMGHQKRIQQQASRLGITPTYKETEGDASYIDLPPVEIVDMRQELRAGNRSIFSRALQSSLRTTLDAGQQAILFLNRRGTSTYVFCRDCGWVLRCPKCEINLTYHGSNQQLTCHHCGYTRSLPRKCPNCQSARIKHFGAGTQTIQNELETLFPGTGCIRWDRDTSQKKGAHQAILANFAAHKADVLIGTQMVAKGLDLPMVTFVGVVSADTGLNLPDYRAAERTFQILTQVAGRAGRGLLGGHAILQTFQPEHYAIQAAAEHDYQSFYDSEIQHRKQLGYPPFTRLARFVIREFSSPSAEKEARRLANSILEKISITDSPADIIGPAPCFIHKLRGTYCWHLILRAANPLELIPETIPDRWSIDIDPVSLL
jgi:primosomal protein N' (replication factor Y)